MAQDRKLREHLLYLLSGGGAHARFEEAVADFPRAQRGERIAQLAHRTPWEILEHMRICQRDILDYMKAGSYQAPPYPDGYWPKEEAPPREGAWEESVDAFLEDLKAIQALVDDASVDLFETVPQSDRHTFLREVLIVADHNAYHIGQLVQLRGMMGIEMGEGLQPTGGGGSP